MEQPPVDAVMSQEEIVMMRDQAKALIASVQQRRVKSETNNNLKKEIWYTARLSVSEEGAGEWKHQIDFECRAVTTAVSNAYARDSSTPNPAESDRTESDERSDYDSSGDKEAGEEYLSVEASDNLGNWNRDNKSETSGIGGTK